MAADAVYRRRNNERIREVLGSLLAREVADPRLDFVTVTGADVAPDTKSARVYVSADPARYEEVLAGLESARGRIQRLLGKTLGWKYTPELRFFIDPAIDEASRIDEVLKGKGLSQEADVYEDED